MTGRATLNKRYLFIAFLCIATVVLIVCGYYSTLPISLRSYVYKSYRPAAGLYDDEIPWGRRSGLEVYRFDNGRIRVTNSRYMLNHSTLAMLDAAKLEELYENVVLELTAECSTARRFGRREDGGWDLCLVGPYTPQQPCFSFSFGVNYIWEFDDQVASQFKCQVLAFDPTMTQESHIRSDRVLFFKEGLHAVMGTVNTWSVNSYLGFLKRFKADSFVIDILKMDIEFSEWPALETAVHDGSLKNVKQLLMETHVDKLATPQQYLNYLALLRSLYDLGFRLWHYNWNTFGQFTSQRSRNTIRTCCHELYFININFLATGGMSSRNPSGSQIAYIPPPAPMLAKTAGFDQLETMRRTDLSKLSGPQLEAMYFTLVEQQHIACPSTARIGDSGDGGWDVCFADPFDIKKSHPCVAFSFGINNIWNYDDQLAEAFHCNVYMYDPSMTTVADHQRKKTSWFYRTGLSSENKVESNGWKMRTLCTLIQEAGYSGKPVDILKIDIEHWEWVSFEKAFEEGCLKHVKQLLFESHTSELVRQKTDYARLIRVWLGLFDLGFRTWKWHKNPLSTFYKSDSGAQRACCYEHYMVNTKLIAL